MNILWFTVIGLVGIAFGSLISTKFIGIALLPFVIAFQIIVAIKQLKSERLPDAREPINPKQVVRRSFQITYPIIVIAVAVYAFWVILFISSLPYESTERWPSFQHLLLNRYDIGSHDCNFSQRMSAATIGLVFNFTRDVFKQTGRPRNASCSARPLRFALGTGPMDVMWTKDFLLFASHVNFFNAVLGTAGVLGCVALWAMGVSRRRKAVPYLVGFLSSFLALVMKRREIFANEYAMVLLFGVLTFCGGLDFMMKKWMFAQGVIMSLAQFLPVFGFVLWCPWAYGLPGGRLEPRVWFHSWECRL
jgi:dolichyl-phosphate-mannose--protein O-mannosyl transferase